MQRSLTRLAELRYQHRYSVRTLARRAGVAYSRLSDYERGGLVPTLKVQARIARALDVAPEDIWPPAEARR
jgi:transcriptional regulator with XRE-family HTH domain